MRSNEPQFAGNKMTAQQMLASTVIETMSEVGSGRRPKRRRPVALSSRAGESYSDVILRLAAEGARPL